MIKALITAIAISGIAIVTTQAQTVQSTPNELLPPQAKSPANSNLAKDTTPPGTVETQKPLSNAFKRSGNRTSATQGYIAEDTTPPAPSSGRSAPLTDAFKRPGDKSPPGKL